MIPGLVPSEVPVSGWGDGGDRGSEGGDVVPHEPDCGDDCGEGRDGCFPSDLPDVRNVGDAEYLLSSGIIGNSKLVDEVDPDEVNVKVVADHELTVNRFSFEFDG